jgi:hypothetical protein
MNMKNENIVANFNQTKPDLAVDIEDLSVAEADTEQVKGGTTAAKDPAFVSLGVSPWITR